MIDKKELRNKIKALRRLLSDEDKLAAAEQVFARLEATPQFLMATHILVYHSLPDEVTTHGFIEKWAGRKKFYLPRVNGVNLDILPYDKSRLELGSFHIEEPTGDDLANPEQIELIITPAVAYDRQGNRLGRGKGYYDRLLRTTRATKIGVAYHFQLVDDIPAEPHDIPVDIVITDKGIFVK